MNAAVPILSASAVAVALAALSTRISPADRPQQMRGEGGTLSVAFGDAKETLSRAMVHKADSYFHGGIDMDCSLDLSSDEEHEHHHHHEEGDESDEGDGHDHRGPAGSDTFDPWRWINAHVKAPQIERHLEGEKAVELMPWFWAAVKADPHNIEAWTTTWYIANNTMKNRELAGRVVEEGLAKNPDSLELWLTKGRYLYQRGTGDVDQAQAIFLKAERMALDRCGGDTSKLSEDDALTYRFIQGYLKKIRERKSSS